MEKGSQEDLIEQACIYLMEKTYPEGCTLNRKRQIRKRAEKFNIVNGELYYAPKDKQVAICVFPHRLSVFLSACLSLVDNHFCQMVRYVQERKEQLRVATACHVDPTSGHMGVKKTVARIRERFAWKGILHDVQQIVSVEGHFSKHNTL